MDINVESIYLLSALFFLVAFIYSSIGLGGGSSYTALMALFGFNTIAIPMISLTLNIFVTTVGSYNFLRNRHGKFKLILPFLLSSVPAAYLGGSIKLSKDYFYLILLISLIFVALKIYVWQEITIQLNLTKLGTLFVSFITGALLGLVAGIVGIGGGIYLVPLIIILGLGSQKEAAACGAVFIWLNSIFGLLSRLQHNSIDLTQFLFLIVAVLAGGFAGSFLGSFILAPKTMEKILGSVIIIAIIFLSKKILTL